MKKLKEKKGITLVALIISIIVLLILAVVAISAVTGDGIINYAKNAKSEYQAAQVNEEILLRNYINYIENNANTKKIITFTIDGKEYTTEEGADWEQWINAGGNEKGYSIAEDGKIVYLDGKSVGFDWVYEYSNSKIVNGKAYLLYSGNEAVS